MLVAYAENTVKFPADAFQVHISGLPHKHREQILRYRFWQDAQACLYGKLLLKRCLEDLGYGHLQLEDLRYTAHQRPYFEGAAIDFNISHSGKFVICALAENIRLGIDIEQVKTIDASDFHNQFSANEMAWIRSDPTLVNFYTLWTKKEALIKADGKGLSIPLQQIEIMDDTAITIENQPWFLTAIRIAEGYCCHLSTSVRLTEPVRVEKYTF